MVMPFALNMLMISIIKRFKVFVLTSVAFFIFSAAQSKADDKPLVDFARLQLTSRIAANPTYSSTFNVDPTGALDVTIAPGPSGYPGVAFAPDGTNWDLSQYGEVAAVVTNTSTQPLNISLRVDNAGDWHTSPWNANGLTLAPSQTGAIRVFFGYSWGSPGYALDPAKVTQLLLFTGKPVTTEAFRVDGIYGAGKPGDHPLDSGGTVAITGNNLVSFVGAGFPESQIESFGATVTQHSGPDGYALINFPAGPLSSNSSDFEFQPPPDSVWDLSDYDSVEFSLKNPSNAPVHVFAHVDNANSSPTDNSADADATIAPGMSIRLIVPFASTTPWDGATLIGGCRLDSGHVVDVSLSSDQAGGSVVVTLVKAAITPTKSFPTWLGKRPPVAGNWTLTLNQNFNTPALDPKVWAFVDKPHASIYDNASVEVPSNAYIANGMLTIKTEKPATMAFDDPALSSRKYLTSSVTTYGKFTQKYGYFESKIKLPTGLGMWPAFWLMPDRGSALPNQWEREDTKNGGMEFDILEYLTRFGPFHYNIAMHWDGYGKQHKFIGDERIYFKADKDGFVTAGLLWGPGEATFYCNGQIIGHWRNDRISNIPAYILFTQPVGGWGTNGYVDESKLPQYLQVKYVRVWQLDSWKNIPNGAPLVPTPPEPAG
jgi:beta-glucanase (GH16 family)